VLAFILAYKPGVTEEREGEIITVISLPLSDSVITHENIEEMIISNQQMNSTATITSFRCTERLKEMPLN